MFFSPFPLPVIHRSDHDCGTLANKEQSSVPLMQIEAGSMFGSMFFLCSNLALPAGCILFVHHEERRVLL